MSDIGPIGRVNPAGLNGSPRLTPNNQTTPTSDRGSDSAEISSAARLASLAANPPLRTELIEQVRSEITAGTYETEEKIDALLEELAIDLA